jgi:hypothetical protein
VNQSAQIDAELNFVIDGSTPSGQPLKVAMSDSFYPNGVYGPRHWWMTHINPLNDEFSGLVFAMPGGLHEFTYHFGQNGRKWYYDFVHRDSRDMNLSGGVGASVNNPVPQTVINNAKLDVATGQKNHFSGSPDALSLGMGSWGAAYHYTVTVNNTGGGSRKVTFNVLNFDSLMVGFKTSGAAAYQTWFAGTIEDSSIPDSQKRTAPDGDGNPAVWWAPVSVWVPAYSSVTFEVVTVLLGGLGGVNNMVMLD